VERQDKRAETERRHVTVLFADISESTHLIENLDPEDAVSVLSPALELMAAAVRRYGGTVIKTLGDGIMAVFGAPVALEKHAVLACRAAIAMQADAETRIALSSPTQGGVRVHIGLATGEVIVGFLEEQSDSQYDAAGFAVHLASCMAALAPSGSIYLSESTHALVREQFSCEALGSRRIRDRADAVPVYRLNRKGQDGMVRNVVEHSRSRSLVGRGAELGVLTTRMQLLLKRQGGIVSIIGEAGIGKSRLVAQLRAIAATRGVQWLEGAGVSFGRNLSYWPFLEILRTHIEVAEDDPQPEQLRKLQAHLERLFGDETSEILPYMATLLGINVGDDLKPRVQYLDGDAMRRQVFRSMRLVVARLANQRPVVLVFEDAFWMDSSSVALLLHLLPLVQECPLLVCLVTRGEADGVEAPVMAHAASEYGTRYDEVRLSPLSDVDGSMLIEKLLQSSKLPQEMRRAVLSVAGGNPLFLEQVVQTLVDTAVIVRDGAGWRVARSNDFRLGVPESIHSVIMARVDRLKESARQTLKTASVLGRAFFVRVLVHVLESDGGVQGDLAILQRADLIFDRLNAIEPEYMFRHVLVQEATYESILLKKRRELHAKVGKALEDVFADRLDEMAGLLAYHYARAELWERAHEYLIKAGNQSDKLAADTEALQHFRNAIRAFERAFGAREDPLDQAIIQRKIGEALYRRGQNEEAARQFRLALGLLGDRDPRSELGVKMEILQQISIQLLHRLLPARLWERRIGTATIADEERVRIYIMQWWLYFFENPLRTLLYSLKTINESEKRGVLSGTIHSSATLGFICDVIGASVVGLHYHRRAYRLAMDTNNPSLIGHAVLGLGWYSAYVGKWDAATGYFARGEVLFREVGDLRQWGSVIWGTVLLLLYQGKLTDALERARELRRSSEMSSDAVNLRWSRLAEGMALLRLDRLAEAGVALETARHDGQLASDWQIWVRATAELAHVRLHQARIDEAMLLASDAMSTVRKQSLKGHHVTTVYNAMAEAALAATERKSGARMKKELRREAGRWCLQALRGGKVFRGSLPHALRLRGTQLWLTGNPSGAITWWRRSLTLSQHLGAAYDTSLTYMEIGRRLGSPADVALGEGMLANMRCDL
jgi:class 3 adenylate cyclase/tetratricopeptide (TPR) repeat protein